MGLTTHGWVLLLTFMTLMLSLAMDESGVLPHQSSSVAVPFHFNVFFLIDGGPSVGCLSSTLACALELAARVLWHE